MIVTLMLLWLTMLAGPDSAIGRSLWRGFVDLPARTLNRIGRGHVGLATLLVVFVALSLWAIGEEATRLLAMGSPELLSWIVMADAATLVDVAMATVLVATQVRLGAMRARCVRIWGHVTKRPRAIRTRAIRAEHSADNDDEEPRRVLAA